MFVGTKNKTAGPWDTWAYNLFVVGLRISYYGSFSAEKLKTTPSWCSLSHSLASKFLNPFFSQLSPIYSQG